MSTKTHKWVIEASLCIAILAIAACSGNSSSPIAPTTPTAAPVVPVVPATASVHISIEPNPVTFSGQPITDSAGCKGSPNTWFYEQNFQESGGANVTFTARTDKFDQRVVNNITDLNLVLPAMGTMSLHSRWCSSQAVAHTAQSSFSGTDANGHSVTVDGPVVNLQSP